MLLVAEHLYLEIEVKVRILWLPTLLHIKRRAIACVGEQWWLWSLQVLLRGLRFESSWVVLCVAACLLQDQADVLVQR